jgi:hypothetical protein
MLSMIAKLITNSVGKGKDDEAPGLLKKFISRDPQLGALPLARHAEVFGLKVQLGPSQSSQSGTATLDGKPVAWRDYVWGEYRVDTDVWHSVRWRFYESGLVCFDAVMSNENTGLDPGDMQGHRIELREKDGLLVGTWVAGFYVRRGLPPVGFHASMVEDHLPLKLHFADLTATQAGAWIRK